MAENSRKNEFFERESIAIIAITTRSSIKVKLPCFTFLAETVKFFILLFLSN